MHQVPPHLVGQRDASVGEAEGTANSLDKQLFVALASAAGERYAKQAEAETSVFVMRAWLIFRHIAREKLVELGLSVVCHRAVAYLLENSPHGGVGDWRPEYPLGPVGKSLMFIGSSLFADKLDENYLVSVTRDAPTGSLNLQAVLAFPLPVNNLQEIWAEQDFKGGAPGAK